MKNTILQPCCTRPVDRRVVDVEVCHLSLDKTKKNKDWSAAMRGLGGGWVDAIYGLHNISRSFTRVCHWWESVT